MKEGKKSYCGLKGERKLATKLIGTNGSCFDASKRHLKHVNIGNTQLSGLI